MTESVASSLQPLPRVRTPLIGRVTERAVARSYLLDEAVPLLTLTGPGGVGKTRLALAIADEAAPSFADGVVWIDLAQITNGALAPDIMAQALHLAATDRSTMQQQIVRFLRSRQVLLLCDNCEHVLPELSALVAAVLAGCPAVQVLATSRAALSIRGEQVLPVGPLHTPSAEHTSTSMIAATEAGRLFIDRARAVDPAFALSEADAGAVASICRRLDGLPLAIELAAAQVALFSPETLLQRMHAHQSLPVQPHRDLPTRQRTIADAIRWSYDLLDAESRQLFRRLAIFVGGFTFDAVQAVAVEGGRDGVRAAQAFSSLVQQNLIFRVDRRESNAEPRFAMLETIRDFGLQQLAASGGEAEARDLHARYFLALTESLQARVAPHVPGSTRILRRLQVEHPNLRSALQWFVDTGAREEFVYLAGALHAFWLHFGFIHEGRQWLERAQSSYEGVSASSRVWALVGLVAMEQNRQGDHDLALPIIEEALVVARSSGDPLSVGLASIYRAAAYIRAGDIASAERSANESRAAFASLPPAPWVERNITHVDWVLSNYALLRGNYAAAETMALDVVARQRELEQRHAAPYPFVSRPQIVLGHVSRIQGNDVAALGHYQGALRDTVEANDVRGSLYALGGVAGVLAGVGRWQEAARLFGALEALCDRYGVGFGAYVMDWQRAIGLPEPWLAAGSSFGVASTLRAALQHEERPTYSPLPDTKSAESLWAEGRDLALDVTIEGGLAVDLTTGILDPAQPPATSTLEDPFHLSPREREVLSLLCQRFTYLEIGDALFISRRTVSTHVSNIYDKLGVSSQRAAAALAASHGLV